MNDVDRRSLLAATFLAASPLVAARGARRRTVQVGPLVVGGGRPKTIVSIKEADRPSVLARGRALGAIAAIDMVELRVDHLNASVDAGQVASLTASLAPVLAGKPLMATFRSKTEGGQRMIDDAAYVELYTAVLREGQAQLIDVELHRAQGRARTLLPQARDAGVAVVMSNHDFTGTPADGEMMSRLVQMHALEADVVKLAVMPHDAADVLRLLAVTAQLRKTIDRPMITMSMGGIGAVSRIAGEVFGSDATFGAVGAVSAPGQIEVGALACMLDAMHAALVA